MDPRERSHLHDDLTSHDEEVRRLAVERLVLLPESEALPHLHQRLGDPSWRVRKAVVARLVGWAERERVQELLVEALADGENPGRRNAAVEALVGCGLVVVPCLLEASRSPDVDVRKLVVDTLAGIRDRRAAARLIELLDDPDPNVRGAAADALALQPGTEAVAPLVVLAGRGAEDPLVRLSALRALATLEAEVDVDELGSALAEPLLRPAAFALLGHAGGRRATEVLLEGLRSPSRTAREAAMEALLRVVSKTTPLECAELVARIRTAGTSELGADATRRLANPDLPLPQRAALAQFLGLLGREDCVLPLLAAGEDEALSEEVVRSLSAMDPVVDDVIEACWSQFGAASRRLACRLLGQRGGRAARELLPGALEDPDPTTRVRAAEALGVAGVAEAAPLLARRLHRAAAEAGPDAEEELAAIGTALVSLARCGEGRGASRRIVDTLGRQLAQASVDERAEIVRILGRTDQSDAAPRIVPLLSDPAPAVRSAAVEALARLGVADTALRSALADESAHVRVSAAAALPLLDPAQGVEDLLRLLQDEDVAVRRASVRSAARLARRDLETAVRGRLLELLQIALTDDASVAITALEGLRRLGGGEAARSARSALERDEPEALQAAIRCIGIHGDGAMLQALIPLVSHEHWMVRAEAIEVLASAGLAQAVPPLLGRLEKERDDFVRGVLLGALERLET